MQINIAAGPTCHLPACASAYPNHRRDQHAALPSIPTYPGMPLPTTQPSYPKLPNMHADRMGLPTHPGVQPFYLPILCLPTPATITTRRGPTAMPHGTGQDLPAAACDWFPFCLPPAMCHPPFLHHQLPTCVLALAGSPPPATPFP